MLPLNDLHRIVQLTARVGEPSARDVFARRRELASGLAGFVAADFYVWSIGVANLGRPGEAMPTTFVDGGWVSDDERTKVFRALVDQNTARVLAGLTKLVQNQQPATLLRRDLVPDRDWKIKGAALIQIGVGDMLFSIYPLPNAGFSCLGLHRRIGKPRFVERERQLVDAVFPNIDWIHRPGLHAEAGEKAVHLSPRQRQVLLMLLIGDSRKVIASKLKLSEHTVIEYMKAIYRQYGVSSRGELLARFISH